LSAMPPPFAKRNKGIGMAIAARRAEAENHAD
jgi:hypothetical protein